MRWGWVLVLVLGCACGRFNFDDRSDAQAGADGSLVPPDVVPLGPCRDVDFEQGGVNPFDVPPLAWRGNELIEGFHANALGVFTVRNGGFAKQTWLNTSAPFSAELVITPDGYLATWLEGDRVKVRFLDLAVDPTAPTTELDRGAAFVRISRQGEEIAALWRSNGALWFQRLDLYGAVLAPKQSLDVGMTVRSSYWLIPHLLGFAAAFRGTDAESRLVRIDARGTVTQRVPFMVPTTAGPLQIVSIGDTNLIAWVDAGQVWLLTVRGNGSVEPARMVLDLSAASSVDIGMTWTRERLAIVSSRDEAQTIRIALHWLDAAGALLGTEDISSFSFTTSGEHTRPTVLGAPGRVAFAVGFAVEPNNSVQQGTYQRCY